MRIRTIDQDLNANQLQVMWGGNGDVYVTIYQNETGEGQHVPMGIPISVRVGMCGSGVHLPGRIGELLAELATEFEKYNGFDFEADAYNEELRKRFEEMKSCQ